MQTDDALPSLHLSKSTLVKELLWLKNNNQLLDYDDSSKHLLQEVQTVQNLKWLTPYYQTLPFTSTSSNARLQTPSARSKSLGSSFKLPFSTNEVISFKNSYSHQPNIIDHIDEVADQSRKDSYVLKRVSELEKRGLLRSRVIPVTGKQIESTSNRAALHVEMEQIAEIFAERRAEKLERLQTIAESARDYYHHMGAEGSRADQERQLNQQKVAKTITRHVMDFWNEIDELLRIKHTESLKSKQKENMGKHLDHLVDQTENFSKSLAMDIQVRGSVNPFEINEEELLIPPPHWKPENSQTSLLSSISMDDETGEGMEEEDDGFEPEGDDEFGLDDISEDFSEIDENSHEIEPVKTKIPFLLKFKLREYQHLGLDWLATMYDKKLNGILADEMGLGKTIMTISLLAHVAVEKGAWGPHLIIVPTSVLLNWDMELRKWCPAFKIVSYYGTPKERKVKRSGWTKHNAFHICITSYQLAIQDSKAFKRKPWHYIILDEAHHIKNSKSQRWQTLLTFNSRRRLLLTGTPIQNNLMELWSLMHFLMPNIFESSSEFKAWFDNPVNSMIEGETEMNHDLIQRLHGILRPFILRRLKSEVEQQLPKKYEHVIFCQLSKRQRGLYEEFIANRSTQNTLTSGNFLGIANVLMQLRKVCNHPDLFEARPILSSFVPPAIVYRTSSQVVKIFDDTCYDLEYDLDLPTLNLVTREQLSCLQGRRKNELSTSKVKIEEIGVRIFKEEMEETPEESPVCNPFLLEARQRKAALRQNHLKELFTTYSHVCEQRKNGSSLYGQLPTIVNRSVDIVVDQSNNPSCYLEYSDCLRSLIKTNEERAQEMQDIITRYTFLVPKCQAIPISLHCSHPNLSKKARLEGVQLLESDKMNEKNKLFNESDVRMKINFPDKALVQYDCGKLQQLDILLRKLKKGGHRALIFTQMTKMLDVFEVFLNLHGHTYLRLDGATKVEKRQQMMEWFNSDPKVFLFILSTRAGGLGINLVGADTVIFYDSDWNPAMDQQAQDRCHRIGQTREVHIYHLISQHTIEENIFKKSKQKVNLQKAVIKQGNFTTDFFQNVDLQSLIRENQDGKTEKLNLTDKEPKNEKELMNILAQAEEQEDVTATKQVLDEQKQILTEFSDDEEPKPKKPAEPIYETKEEADYQIEQKKKRKELIQKLVGRADWEDELNDIQRYALHYLQHIDPIIDTDLLISQHKAIEINQEKWEKDHKKKPVIEESSSEEGDNKLIIAKVHSSEVEAFKKHYENYVEPNNLKRMIEEEEIEIDPFLQSKPKKQKRNIDEDEDEVDELMAASDSTDYEGEDTYDSDDDAISDEMVK